MSTNDSEATGSTSVASSIDSMAVGDIYVKDFSSGSATLTFPQSGEQYLMVVESTRTDGASSTATVANLAGALANKSLTVPTASSIVGAMDVQERFDLMLRTAEQQEFTDADAALTNVAATPQRHVSKSVSTGTSNSFRVLSSLGSTSVYRTVTATVRCSNDRVAVYLDNDVSDSLTDTQLQTLCAQYQQALSTEYDILGEPPDINGDGVVTVLLTKAVNQLGASGGGIITGFFYAGDMFPRSSSLPVSNQQEIIYGLVPDPNGTYGTPIPTDFALSNLLTAVVPHEVQHLLSYNYHVLVNGGTAEASWLNEAMSHLIEDVVGYGQENPSRVELFLASTADAGIVTSSSPNLAERGAGYLFLRYLYEQASDGNALLRALVQTSSSGVNNVMSAYNSSIAAFDEWKEFLQRWSVAVAVTNAGLTTDSRYIYHAQTYNSTTGHYQGVCLQCDAQDNRGTVLTGASTENLSGAGGVTLRASSGVYYDLSAPPTQVTVQGSSSNMQIVVIRLQ